jgi:hypothetical protein
MKKITLLIAIMFYSLGYSQSLPITFSNPLDNEFIGSGGSVYSAAFSPSDSANPVGKIVGGTDQYNSNISLRLGTYIDMTTSNKTFTFKWYNTEAKAMTGLFQINNEALGGYPIEKTFTTTAAIGWQTITINFSSATNGYPNANKPVSFGKYAGISIFTNFGLAAPGYSSTYYVDDISGAANGTVVPVSGPSVAATTPPTRATSDVFSIFSGAYTNVVGNLDANFCGIGSITEIKVAGNATKAYLGNGCQGIDFQANRIDASLFTNLHIDFYTTETNLVGKVFNLKLVDFGTGTATTELKNVQINLNTGTTPAIVSNGWISVDVPVNLSGFTGLAQAAITSNLNNTVWYDNFYLYKAPAAAGTPVIGSLIVPTKNNGDAPFTLTTPTSTSPGTFTYSSSNTAVATISGSTVTIVGAGISTITANQAPSGSYIAGSVTADLIVRPSAAPTPPSRVTSDVVSIYSSAYTAISGVNTTPSWNQSTVATEVSLGGNNALQYANFNYQGIDWVTAGSAKNISNMQYLHLDIWTNNQTPNLYVISSGADIPHAISSVAGSWQSLDIPVAGITGDLTSAIQIKFDGGTGGTMYLDNVYFWKAAAAPGTPAIGPLTVLPKYSFDAPFTLTKPTSDSPGAFTYTSSNTAVATISGSTVTIVGAGSTTITANQAASGSFITGSVSANLVVTAAPTTAAPIPPNRNAADVISIFSDKYTNITIDNWNAAPIWYAPTGKTVQDISIAGNATKKVDFPGFIGVDFSTLANHKDLTSMERFHMDIWTGTATLDKSFNLKLSNFLSDNSAELNAIEFSTTNASNPALPDPNPGTWISLDMPLSAWTGINGTARNNIAQFIVTSDLGSVYFDNVYIYKGTALGTTDFQKSTIKVYPNPASTNLNIDANSTIDKVAVYNLLGQEVISKYPNSNHSTIDISSLQTGTYILKTTSDSKTETSRILKK